MILQKTQECNYKMEIHNSYYKEKLIEQNDILNPEAKLLQIKGDSIEVKRN